MNGKKVLMELAKCGVNAVRPENFMSRGLRVSGDKIVIYDWNGSEVFSVSKNDFGNLYLFGVGKASRGMFSQAVKILNKSFSIKDGLVVTNESLNEVEGFPVITSSHPVPDERSIYAAMEIVKKFSDMKDEDFFIFLLSGGGSALLEWPIEPIQLEDLKKATRLFLESGMDIFELNTLRKHLSKIKGGKLARLTKAKGVVLVLSDVIGDNLEFISSGLLYGDSTSYGDVDEILKRYDLWGKLPKSVENVFRRGIEGEIEETPKKESNRIKNVILSNNSFALREIKKECNKRGIDGRIITSTIRGEAREVAKVLVSIAEGVSGKIDGEDFKKPICLIFGGETTVTVRGDGMGGRNQELVLSALKEIRDRKGISVLSMGSDGIDGKSDAAGGVVDGYDFLLARKMGLKIDLFLENNDSNTFLRKIGAVINTGKTGTNVCDIILIFIN